jgi:DNA-binding CsgD family transcriptional regulator
MSSPLKPISMPLDKCILLEEIKTVIERNSRDTNCGSAAEDSKESSTGKGPSFSQDLSSIKNSIPNKRSRRSFLKLEQRVEILEEQSNDLLYFIHFLFRNFPELVRNIMNINAPTAKEKRNEANREKRLAKADSTQLSFDDDRPLLTRRELEIINLLVKGMCAKEIAHKLFISETTVITHKKNLKKKFNVRNTAELIGQAFLLNSI